MWLTGVLGVCAAGESPRVRSLREASPLLRRHYYEEADPDRALAMLEEEMSAAVPHHDSHSDASNRSTAGLDTLRTLLERECEAQVGAQRWTITNIADLKDCSTCLQPCFQPFWLTEG